MAKSNGLTQRDMITEMRTAMVGMDGNGGMKKDIADIKEEGKLGRAKLHERVDVIEGDVQEVENVMVTKDNCEKTREAKRKEDRRQDTRFWDKWPKIVAPLLVLASLAVALYLGLRS